MKIKPAPLTPDLDELKRQFSLIETYAEEIDVDIVDWKRSDLKTVSVNEVLENLPKLIINFDLMMDKPSEVLDKILEVGTVRNVLLYIDIEDDISEMIEKVKNAGKKVFVSFDSPDDYEKLEELLPELDGVQIFTVTPGAQGNPFKPEMLDFAERLRKSGFGGEIGIDGGVNVDTLPLILEHDIDYVSVGSALSKAGDPEFVYRELEEIVHERETE